MSIGKRKKIVSLLGVGFDAEDDHIRITKGDKHDVYMGSEESHDYIQQVIKKIEDEMKRQGRSLDDFSPEEFTKFVGTVL